MTLISRFTPPPSMPQPGATGAKDVASAKGITTAAGLADGQTGAVPAEIGQRFGMPRAANPLKPLLPLPSAKLGGVQAGAISSQAKMPDVLTTVGIILFGDLKDLAPKATGVPPTGPQTMPTQAQLTDALTKLAYLMKH